MSDIGKSEQRGLPRQIAAALLSCLLAACGGGGGGGGPSPTPAPVPSDTDVVKGLVFDGNIENAIVCADANGNGRCDAGEAQVRSNAQGAYELTVARGYAGPLAAEVVAGQSRDADDGGVPVDRSYRMASPARAYATDITPFTTMVRLTGTTDYALAEELVRNDLGLPPRFDLKPAAAPAAGTLTRAVAKAVVASLKSTAATVDYAAPGALAAVVAAFPRELTTLPTLAIETKDHAPIVSKEVYLDATFVLTNPASAVSYPLNGKIRGRGHSTWGWPKNPYKVQFKEDAALAAVPDVLGMPKSRNWVLLADWFDRSLVRNKLAFSLANTAAFPAMAWNPSAQHVEVTLNGDYVGVYLLAQDIRIASDRLALKKMSSDPVVNDVDGGYIVEVDARLDCYNDGILNLQLVTGRGVPICVDTPDEGSITQNQLAYVKNLLRSVEEDIYAVRGLPRIHAASFADWYLLNELFKNNDSIFWSSVFMWKDTDAAADPTHRVLNLGPIWDYDLSAGNVFLNGNWLPTGCWVAKASVPNWIAKLFDDPAFVDLTLARWKQVRPHIEKFVNASIDTYVRRLDAAEQRNFARWPILGTPLASYYTWNTYAEEVAFLKGFLNERLAWLDKAYESPASFAAMCK